MSQRNPDKILEIHDSLDLEDPEERRIALLCLNDYFGAILAEVGNRLDFRTSDYSGSIGHQWNKASSRLEKIDSVDVDEELNEALETIHGLRGDYAHDFRDFPPSEPINSARETAPDWAEWIREAAEEYEEYQESLTATEALIQVGERVLGNMLEDWQKYPRRYRSDAEDLHIRATELDSSLTSFKGDESVSKELVDVISEIMEWEREKDRFEDEFETWRQAENERLELIDRAENTHNFLVIDEVNDLDRITLMKHDIAEPDSIHTIAIPNCPLSDKEKEYLRKLEEDDEVRLWLGSEMYRNNNGYFDQEDIIKEVEDVTGGP